MFWWRWEMYCTVLVVREQQGSLKATVVQRSRYRCQPRHIVEVEVVRIMSRHP